MPVNNVKTLQHYFRHNVSVFTEKSSSKTSSLDLVGSFEGPHDLVSCLLYTSFYSTNCAMQEPLINAVLDAGAIFPEQCCPSPTHGYPGAIGLEITDEIQGNMPGILGEINRIVVSRGGAGRFATWPVPCLLYTSYFRAKIA